MREEREGGTYTAEEMADEDYKHSARDVVASIDTTKRNRLSISIQQGESFHLPQVFLRRDLVVGG